jgi:hypothetical protein
VVHTSSKYPVATEMHTFFIAKDGAEVVAREYSIVYAGPGSIVTIKDKTHTACVVAAPGSKVKWPWFSQKPEFYQRSSELSEDRLKQAEAFFLDKNPVDAYACLISSANTPFTGLPTNCNSMAQFLTKQEKS